MALANAQLQLLADAYGIATEFWDWKGRLTQVSEETVVAVLRALDAFDRKLVLILGGRNKGGDYLQLKDSILRSVRSVLAIGESSKEVKTVLGPYIRVTEMPSLEEAVRKGLEEARTGECVLLSPACSSFDMFRDYEERARCYIAVVKAL